MIRSVTSEKGTVTFELQRKSVKNFNLRIRSDGTVYVSVPKSITLKKADEFVEKHIDFILKHQRRIKGAERKSPQHYYLGEAVNVEVKEGEMAYARLAGNILTVYLPFSAVPDFSNASEVLGFSDISAVSGIAAVPDTSAVPANSEEERERLIEEIILCWQKERARELFPSYLKKAYQRFIKAGLSIPYPTITVKSMKTRWGSCTPAKKKITLNCSLTEKTPLCAEYVVCHELAHFLQQDHSARFYGILDRVMPKHRELRRILNSEGR